MNPSIQDAQPCDIVAFTAHPDDAELNCGGTLAAAVAHGWKAGIVDFSRGELGTRGTPEIRAREAAAAARALGLACRLNLGLPDGALRDDDATRAFVVHLLRVMRPRVVIAPPLTDHHADHMAVAETVSRSFYLAGVAKYGVSQPDETDPGAAAGPWRPRALLHYTGSRITAPALVVDITGVYEARRKAILCFASQFYREGSEEPPTRISHPDFFDALEGRARHYGSLIGARYGEAYTMPEPVGVIDVVSLYDREAWEHKE
jgi:bacillithiol biosynthesis deacetylase BshB1